jgi:hypothetical protein
LSSRWFAMSNTHPDREKRGSPMTRDVLIAVSADEDPTHAWKGVLYQVPRDAVDNNKLGLDKNGLYMSAIVGVGSKVVPMLAIPKADLLWKGDQAPSLAHVNYFETPKISADPARGSHGSRGEEGMIPAYDLDPAKKPGDPMIFVNRFQAAWDGETAIQIRKVTWTSPTKAEMTGPFTIGLGRTYTEPKDQAAQPPLADKTQVSPPIRPGGGRIVNAVVKHGSVWMIAATQVGAQPGAFWVQIDLKTLKVMQQGSLGDPSAALVFPSLNVDADGNVGIGLNRMSASEYPSVWVTGRLKTDPPGTVRPMVRAAAGSHVYLLVDWDTAAARAGVNYMDHSTVVVDPADPTLFWTYHVVTTQDMGPIDKDGKKVGTGAYGTMFVAWRVGPPRKSTK